MNEFDFAAPSTLAGALEALGTANGNGRALAGGTDLIDQIRTGACALSILVDIKRIPELNVLEVDGGRNLRIGGAVTCTDVNSSPLVSGSRWSMVLDGTRIIGDVKIQNRASLAGNICNAAPSADGVIPLICLDARAVLAGKNGSREVAVEEIFVGPGETILESGELLTAIVIPERPECSAGSYRRMTPRAEMDIAFVGVGSWMALNDDGVVEDCRIALSAVAPTPIRAASAEDVLRGSPMTDARVEEAAEKAATEARPISDHRSSAEYRLHVVRALTRRTLDDCATRLRGNERSDWP